MKLKRDPAPALSRGLNLLLRLQQNGPSNLEQLAHATQWPKASIFRLLQSLAAAGTIARDPDTKRYENTMQLLPVPNESNSFKKICRSKLIKISEQTLQTSELHIFKNQKLQMVDRVEPVNAPILVRARIGWERNLDEVDALTQLVFAFGLSEKDWPAPLFWYWNDTIKKRISRPQLKKVIQDVQRKRSAHDLGINNYGVRRYASPLFDGDSQLLGILALAEAVHPSRIKPDPKLQSEIHAAAGEISQNMKRSL